MKARKTNRDAMSGKGYERDRHKNNTDSKELRRSLRHGVRQAEKKLVGKEIVK